MAASTQEWTAAAPAADPCNEGSKVQILLKALPWGFTPPLAAGKLIRKLINWICGLKQNQHFFRGFSFNCFSTDFSIHLNNQCDQCDQSDQCDRCDQCDQYAGHSCRTDIYLFTGVREPLWAVFPVVFSAITQLVSPKAFFALGLALGSAVGMETSPWQGKNSLWSHQKRMKCTQLNSDIQKLCGFFCWVFLGFFFPKDWWNFLVRNAEMQMLNPPMWTLVAAVIIQLSPSDLIRQKLYINIFRNFGNLYEKFTPVFRQLWVTGKQKIMFYFKTDTRKICWIILRGRCQKHHSNPALHAPKTLLSEQTIFKPSSQTAQSISHLLLG